MKKLILFLLPLFALGQNPTNFPYGIKNNAATTVSTVNYLTTADLTGVYGKVTPENVTINLTPVNYSAATPTLGAHLTGIDNKIGSIVATTAGVTTRVWFTADVSAVSATNYYASNATGKGTLASAIQSVSNNDNEKKYYTQDIIGSAFATATLFPPGVYAGNLSASTTPNSAQQRWTVELYKCNNAGTPIASGITGAPVGSLGVTVITILDSGLLTLTDASVTNVPVSGNLSSQLSMAVGERVRYHVSAEKVGTASASITQSVYFGTSYNSYLDVPVPLNTNAVQNLSGVTGATTTEALNNLNSGKENISNKSDSYTISSSTTYASTKALVDGLNTRVKYMSLGDMRALSGTLPAEIIYSTNNRLEGVWRYDPADTTSADDLGSIIVTADGKRLKRITDGHVMLEWFGAVPDGVSGASLAITQLFSYLTANGGGVLQLKKGYFNLEGATITLPANTTLDFRGGGFKNGVIIGVNSKITGMCTVLPSDNLTIAGTFLKSNTIYDYATMTEMKTFIHWPNKLCKTRGFYFENDGGGADYIVNTATVFASENSFFTGYWQDTDTAGGAGLFVKLTNTLSAKYISENEEINLAVFGVKYDANFLNPSDKKYYVDSGYTVLATDNYAAVVGAVGQLQNWALGQLPRTIVLSNTLIINSTLFLDHGAYGFVLKGNGYADFSVISSNSNLNALVENRYDVTTPNALTGSTYTIQDITFKGHDRIINGLIVKNGYEADGLSRLQFNGFTNAGLVLYGISSTFKFDTVSCFHNKYGVLVTSTHPYRITDNTQNVDGLLSLYKLSGDYNTDALLAIDCTSQGASINVQSIKSENNDNATVLIMRSSAEQYISIKNAFSNTDGDFLKIEDYVGELPTIELEGVFHNDPDEDNYDINDLKNVKQIRFFKNPTAAFPHVIYTNAIMSYENGFYVYRDGDSSNYAPLNSPIFTGTPTAPTATVGTNTTQIATTAFVQQERVLPVTETGASFSLTDAYNGKVVILTASCTVTIPNGLVAGFECSFVTLAGATLTIATGGSVVLFNNVGTTMAEKLSFTLKNRTATNNYITVGSL